MYKSRQGTLIEAISFARSVSKREESGEKFYGGKKSGEKKYTRDAKGKKLTAIFVLRRAH